MDVSRPSVTATLGPFVQTAEAPSNKGCSVGPEDSEEVKALWPSWPKSPVPGSAMAGPPCTSSPRPKPRTCLQQGQPRTATPHLRKQPCPHTASLQRPPGSRAEAACDRGTP